MNPVFVKFLGSFVRWAATLFFGYLLQKGIVTAEESQGYIAALTDGANILWFLGMVGPMLWGLYEKYKGQIKLNTALASSSPMSEKTLETSIKLDGAAAPASTPKDEVPVVTPEAPKA